ncbi:DUF938 domain-containing protein [Sphingobium chlorophenolicum]|uniref:SAM-dependent methyltransferase n=1 Tax=Sphingobium chlorophenolicum TaxID=46429 RepID=A0A081RJ37_SPHCR|nr:DUF938 domain-containing protein [Sphingobium chlorophenolicum]KEQ55210.1 hypothetical protein BV95_00373 [Sphingobium chlorophenolicum]
MTGGPEPWEPGSGSVAAGKRYAPATGRNRDAILAVLREELPSSGLVLEVASGSGEHIVHFAAALPALDWQPTDPDPAALASIDAWREEAGLPNVRPPIRLNAAIDWPVEAADAVLCINMVHISEWAATAGLFRGCAKLLSPGAPLIIYGPFLEVDVATAPTNRAFDRSLKERNSEWGLRNVADLDRVGDAFGLARDRRVEMPANNLMLIYRPRLS